MSLVSVDGICRLLRATHAKHSKKNFDEDITLQDTERKYVRNSEKVQTQFIPMRQWVIEERQSGQTTQQAVASWKDAIRDPLCRKRVVNNVQLIGVFRGIMAEGEHGKDNSLETTRKRNIPDVAYLQEALSQQGEKAAKLDAQYP